MLVKPISLSDLYLMVKTFHIRFPNISPSHEAIMYAISATILRTYIGDEWCNAKLPNGTKPDQHLTPKTKDNKSAMMMQERVVSLAEMIFNLQNIPGSSERFKRLKSQNLETAVAELESATLLQLSNQNFKFVLEKKKKKYDYDISLTLQEELKVCCETKCKPQSTELTSNTLKNTLKKAARQLPSTHPGIIFIKIPETWISIKELKLTIDMSAADFLRQNSRVSEIIFFWEETELNQTGSYIRKMMFLEMINTNSKFSSVHFGKILHQLSPILLNKNWITFRNIAMSANFNV